MFEVLTSEEFDKDYGKLDKSIRVRVDKALDVFVIAMSEKKDQQATIDSINKLIPFYREEIKKRFKA